MYMLCNLHSFSNSVVSEAKTDSIGTTWAWAGTCQETQAEAPLLNLQKDTKHVAAWRSPHEHQTSGGLNPSEK